MAEGAHAKGELELPCNLNQATPGGERCDHSGQFFFEPASNLALGQFPILTQTIDGEALLTDARMAKCSSLMMMTAPFARA